MIYKPADLVGRTTIGFETQSINYEARSDRTAANTEPLTHSIVDDLDLQTEWMYYKFINVKLMSKTDRIISYLMLLVFRTNTWPQYINNHYNSTVKLCLTYLTFNSPYFRHAEPEFCCLYVRVSKQQFFISSCLPM